MESPAQQQKWTFTFDRLEDLAALCERCKIRLPVQEDVSVLAQPVQAGSLQIPNSLAIHPMEGCDGDEQGRPGELTLRRYRRFAEGGAGLIWAEAIAVAPEGRANPHQLWIHEDSVKYFRAMVDMMRSAAAASMGSGHRPVLVAQLTHSGRYSKPQGKPQPIIPVRDPYRDPLSPEPEPTTARASRIPDDWPLVTDAYLDRLPDVYADAAQLAFDAGFDAVDIKACHGYLINELLAAHTREGRYGGSFENRTRVLLGIIDRIRQRLGDKPVTLRLGVYDAIPYPYGWGINKKDYRRPDLTEPRRLIRRLQDRDVRLVNITLANPYYNPHFGRPFNEPIRGGYTEPEHPAVGVHRLIEITGKLQKEFPAMALVGTGYSWLRHFMPNVAAAIKSHSLATLVGGGRMALAYPDFAKDILQKGELDPNKVCVGCSACTQIMRDGGMAGCVVRDGGIYGPVFRRGRMHDKDNLLRLAKECRQCQDATCTRGCPAGVQIPQFIHAFLEGDEKQAYEIIRKANILPEVCAWLCPVEQQCQGHCLQEFIGDQPLPIAEIQRHVAEQANRNGWSRLRLPKPTTGRRIAILGAGPAGLSAAASLLEAGHRVTIYDRSTELGGMVQSVIPTARQCDSLRNEVEAIFSDIPSDRLTLELGRELSPQFTLDHILNDGYDAAFIGMGLPKAVAASNETVEGVYNAMDFLAQARNKKSPLRLKGKKVAVIGGGNTAMDAAVTARKAGAKDVYVIYRRSFEEMPASPAERDRAMNGGIHFIILTQQLGYETKNGRLQAVRVCPVQLGIPDDSGRRRPEPIIAAAYMLGMDAVIESIGQEAMRDIEAILPGVKIDKGLIQCRSGSFATSREGVYAGGDLVRGPSTVVAAVADGMAAAREMNDHMAVRSR